MIRVLVTAIGGGGHGDQILKALRLAEPGRYTIFGADANPSSPQAALVDKFVTLPLARDPNYLSSLLQICRELDVQVLFHGCEPELRLFAEHRKTIEALGILLPINDSGLIELCMNKLRTNARLAELGFPATKYINVTRESELDTIDWFPVVVKPATGGGGSANVYLAQTMKELKALAAYLGLGENTPGFMIQEYVGTPEHEYTVGVLHDLDGRYLNSIAVRRHLHSGLSVRVSVPNRTGRSELGPRLVISSGVSQGDIGRFEEVTAQCREIADRLGSKGPLNFQCRLVNGKVQVFEINPRFSGTTSLRAMVGFNEPDILVRRHLLLENID
ncbi:MAG: ATP-grasp domain-containing protein, partial [Anaerolineales bacterium]|nr:ATP-grasp domain-containing protein [Anaerolineales bacterium]